MLKLPKLRTATFVCLVIILAIAVLFAVNRYQYRIMAVVWHMRHGNFVSVAGYRFAVPRAWWAEQPSADEATFWNSRTGESIWVHAVPHSPTFTLQGWTEAMEKRMNTPELPIVARHDLRLAGSDLVCLESDYSVAVRANVSRNPATKRIHLPSVDCMSGNRVEIIFFDGIRGATRSDYSELYSLIASVQKEER